MESEPVKAIIERIAQECKEAGATEWDTIKVIKHLNEQNSSNKDFLRKKTSELLKQLNPKAGEIFDSFNRMQVRTSAQEIESFDRGNITKSLLKETSIPRSLAEKISAEVEDKIKDLKIKHLNTALIREMVDVKLLEYGLEEIHKQYARIGMPVFEVAIKIENELFENKEILAEYNLLKIIPKNLGDAHLLQEIHINNLCDFSTKLESFSFNSIIESNDFVKAAIELSDELEKNMEFFSNSTGINSINFLLHKSIQEMNEKHFSKNAELLLRILKQKNAVIGINLFQSESIKQKIEKDKIIDFGIIFAETLQKNNFSPAILIDSKYKLKLLKQEIFEKEIKIVNSEKQCFIHSNSRISELPLIASSFALNLEKLAIENIGKETAFLQGMNALIQKIGELKQLKLNQLERKNYLKQFDLQKSAHELQLIELFNASMIFLQKKELDKEAMQFCEKIVQNCKEILEKECVVSLPLRGEAIERFSKTNARIYSIERKLFEKIELNKNSPISRNLNYFFTARTRKEIDELLDNNSAQIIVLPTSGGALNQT